MTVWRKWTDGEERAEEKSAPQQPIGHDRLCGCDDCMAWSAQQTVQRIIDRARQKPRPIRQNSRYNPHRCWSGRQ